MSDLIERRTAIDALNELFKNKLGDDASFLQPLSYYLGAIHDAKAKIRQIPSVKSDVVRCNECKYADWYAAAGGEKYCYCMETGASGRTENDFCSYGERDYDGGSD